MQQTNPLVFIDIQETNPCTSVHMNPEQASTVTSGDGDDGSGGGRVSIERPIDGDKRASEGNIKHPTTTTTDFLIQITMCPSLPNCPSTRTNEAGTESTHATNEAGTDPIHINIHTYKHFIYTISFTSRDQNKPAASQPAIQTDLEALPSLPTFKD